MKIRSTKAFKDAVNVTFDTQTMKFTAAAERVRLPLGQRSGYLWGKSPPTFGAKVRLPFGERSAYLSGKGRVTLLRNTDRPPRFPGAAARDACARGSTVGAYSATR